MNNSTKMKMTGLSAWPSPTRFSIILNNLCVFIALYIQHVPIGTLAYGAAVQPYETRVK